MWNASDEAFGSTIIQFAIGLLLFIGLTFFMVRGLTSRKGLFSRFGLIVLGVVILGGLLYWQITLDNTIIYEMEAANIDTSDIGFSFTNYLSYIYILGILVTGVVWLRNRNDIKNWFPARK
jgi:hypothetical protein